MWVAGRPNSHSKAPPSTITAITTAHELAREPAKRTSRIKIGSVLLTMCSKLACRNGMAGIPTRPLGVRGVRPKEFRSKGKTQSKRKTSQMAATKKMTPLISCWIVCCIY
jgi:hypothetical protein